MTKREALTEALAQMEVGISYEVGNRLYFFDDDDAICCRQSGHEAVSGISINDFATLCDIEARGRA